MSNHNIKVWKIPSNQEESKTFLEWLSILGITPNANNHSGWSKKDGQNCSAKKTIVDTDKESPYQFGKNMRIAVGEPEESGYPYADIYLTNGWYWCWGENAISYMKSSIIGAISENEVEKNLEALKNAAIQ
jgi:hypothetical protein